MSTISRRGRSRVAVFAVVAVLASLLALPLPAGAATAACPDTIPSAGFTDMAAYPAAVDAVNCIAFYEVTGGTGDGTTYGPALPVPRKQMAIFLWKVLVAGGATIDTTDAGFTDLAGLSATAVGAINAIANANVTGGTGDGTTFSPDAIVTRKQMAMFIAATLKTLGVTLDETTDFGFTDLAGVSDFAKGKINGVANAGIAAGTVPGAKVFSPDQDTTRVQMAYFLTATLEEAGVVPAGTAYYVTSVDISKNTLKYSDGSAQVTLTWKDTDSFKRNGSAVTLALFESTLNTLDLSGAVGAGDGIIALKISPSTLDVLTGQDAKSGLVGTVAATEAWIVEPVSGYTIGEIWYGAGFAENLFSVDGAATTAATFDANISVGDMVASSGGDGSTTAKIRTLALTNGTVSGTVTNDGTGVFTVGKLVVPDPVDADTKTADGDSVATAAAWLAELTVGDSATYSRAAGKQTYSLTNAAPSALSGKAVVALVALVDDGVPANEHDLTITIVVDGTPEPVSIVDANDNATAGDAVDAVDEYKVDGVITDSTDFLAKITPGDMVVFQPADAVTKTDSSISLTNVNGIPTATEVTLVTQGADTLLIELGDGNDNSDAISYTATSVLGLSVGAGGVVKYQVNGVASANVDDWEDDADAFVIAPSITPKVTLTKVGVDLVWNVTTSS